MTYDDSDALQNSWPASSRRVHQQWDKFTDNDVKSIDGRSDILVSRLEERYGYSRERAERECQQFLDELESSELSPRAASRGQPTMPSGNARAPGSPAPQSFTSRTSSVPRTASANARTGSSAGDINTPTSNTNSSHPASNRREGGASGR
jgi:uncharacterized protein YjbJ (UPF0337 family)